jgi:hypothetical protein
VQQQQWDGYTAAICMGTCHTAMHGHRVGKAQHAYMRRRCFHIHSTPSRWYGRRCLFTLAGMKASAG